MCLVYQAKSRPPYSATVFSDHRPLSDRLAYRGHIQHREHDTWTRMGSIKPVVKGAT